MSILVEMTQADAIEFAYGLLWHTTNDRYTLQGRCVSDARVALNNVLTMERKGRGIERAKKFLKDYPLKRPKQPALSDDDWRKINAAWEKEGME